MKLTVNLDDLTIGDLADIEDATGVSLSGVNLGAPPLKIIPALVWIQERRANPAYTYAEARAIKLSELTLAGEAPTLAVAAGDGQAASAPNS